MHPISSYILQSLGVCCSVYIFPLSVVDVREEVKECQDWTTSGYVCLSFSNHSQDSIVGSSETCTLLPPIIFFWVFFCTFGWIWVERKEGMFCLRKFMTTSQFFLHVGIPWSLLVDFDPLFFSFLLRDIEPLLVTF